MFTIHLGSHGMSEEFQRSMPIMSTAPGCGTLQAMKVKVWCLEGAILPSSVQTLSSGEQFHQRLEGDTLQAPIKIPTEGQSLHDAWQDDTFKLWSESSPAWLKGCKLPGKMTLSKLLLNHWTIKVYRLLGARWHPFKLWLNYT